MKFDATMTTDNVVRCDDSSSETLELTWVIMLEFRLWCAVALLI